MSKLTHLDDQGHAHMVDVSEKASTFREARACGLSPHRDALPLPETACCQCRYS